VTDIKEYISDGRPGPETIYDHDNLFVVVGGEKRLANHLTRQDEICALTKFGLKPIYPRY
jgi:hypothetical protein